MKRILRLSLGYVPQAHPSQSDARILQAYTDSEALSWFKTGLAVIGAASGFVANKDQEGMWPAGLLLGGVFGLIAGVCPILTIPLTIRNVYTSDRPAKEYLRIHYNPENSSYSWKN